MNSGLYGVLPVLKPAGWTSHDVVARMRRILRVKRIGHTGTLDPQVTGVLPLCIGQATRLVEYIQEMPKEYEAELSIGYATDTEDATGRVLERAERVDLSERHIRDALLGFVGEIEQVPPMYSAVKVDGRRLYEWARQGEAVERRPRRVRIYSLEPLSVDVAGEYPRASFRVRCSKGTYIRTLCSDIGRALGYPAVMEKLVRTETGGIRIGQCLTVEQIERLHASGAISRALIAPDRLLAHFPSVQVPQAYADKARCGQKIPFSACGGVPDGGDWVRLYSPDAAFIGLFKARREEALLIPGKVFQDQPDGEE